MIGKWVSGKFFQTNGLSELMGGKMYLRTVAKNSEQGSSSFEHISLLVGISFVLLVLAIQFPTLSVFDSYRLPTGTFENSMSPPMNGGGTQEGGDKDFVGNGPDNPLDDNWR